jgi:hypothetical protein
MVTSQNRNNMKKQLKYNDQQKTAILWTLIGSLNTAKYCLTELKTMRPKTGAMIQIEQAINRFFTFASNKMTNEEKKHVENLSFENVALITETIGMMSQIPESQIDWVANEVNKLAFAAINRENETNKQNTIETGN